MKFFDGMEGIIQKNSTMIGFFFIYQYYSSRDISAWFMCDFLFIVETELFIIGLNKANG
ncbi:Uncharacterised protein [Escherichia coli]|uniref:Uncharacterized protein n=1 Tax=Escherichia coli TaxID=562 RepID=A0A376MN73_ECOLX|nr:Uncharacterised protein [Escherichia coli]